MLCYHDKTWCSFYNTCNKGESCSRSLTDKVRDDADIWWGKSNPPIMTFTEPPNCYKSIKDED